MSNNQPRMAENYEIIAAFPIGDKEVVFGRDLNCDKPYFCGLYSKENIICYEEYTAARASSLTAFYTPPVVIEAMYNALSQMGLRNGNILEPSCGVGNFIGMLPDSMADSKIYGVELDSISGRIASQLYQNSSIAVTGFEKVDMSDSFFDAAIGNVPFGDFKVLDKRYDKHKWLIHDYFFGKTLDKVRSGGIVAFITSKGTMDKENSAVRKYLAQRADLIGAIGKTTFIVNVKQSESAKKPLNTVFQEICRHEMLGDFSADKYLNLENLQKSS